jgi:cytochrome c553
VEKQAMNKLTVAIVTSALLALSAGAAWAEGNPIAGKRKAEDCGDCHGPDGRGDGDTIPALAGLPVEKFTQALADFKSGKRRGSSMMKKQGLKLSEQDVADLAAYYAQLKP